jgi:hypothetical protein
LGGIIPSIKQKNFWKFFPKIPLPKGKEDIFINMKYIITERQNRILMESIPVGIRRRYGVSDIISHMEVVLDEFEDTMDICDFSTSGFIGKISEITLGDILYDYEYEQGGFFDSDIKDELYEFIYDTVEDYLHGIHVKKCK